MAAALINLRQGSQSKRSLDTKTEHLGQVLWFTGTANGAESSKSEPP